jgi:regulator of RNase E activity RraB
MNLKENSIGNIQRIMSDFVDNEKLSNKRKEEIARYISAVAVNSFRIGYQIATSEELTEEQFNTMIWKSKTDVAEALSELIFQISI